MLVVAPHHDDEVIGAGGAMLLQKLAEGEVHVVFTQDGGDEHTEDGRSREDQVAIREAEAEEAGRILGLTSKPRFLRMKTLQGEEFESLVDALEDEVRSKAPDLVLSPFLLDYNHHHQLTNYALAEALSRFRRPPRVWGYEVWGLAIPNVIVNIDEVATQKFEALGAYRSQLVGRDYVQGVQGLNLFHGSSLGAGQCRYAERFFDIPGREFVQTAKGIAKTVRSETGSGFMVF